MATLTEKAAALVDRTFAHEGSILEVRSWPSGNITEIDLHLPGASMRKWQHAQHIKIKTAPLAYRDYTPCDWDADTGTCTVFADTGHQGKGSLWAQNVNPNDTFSYMGPGPTPHRPPADTLLVCLGDRSSIGHFMALRQLAGDKELICGAVLLEDAADREMYRSLREPLEPVSGAAALLRWLDHNPVTVEDVCFFLAGQSSLVAALRKELKQRGVRGNQIKAQGFWS